MPMVVKAPDHHAILFDKVSFRFINPATQVSRLIGMVVKSRLVHDQQVYSGSMRPLANIKCRTERRRNAFDDRVRIADLEGVHCFTPPLNTDILLNMFDYLSRRDSLRRRRSTTNKRNSETCKNEKPSS